MYGSAITRLGVVLTALLIAPDERFDGHGRGRFQRVQPAGRTAPAYPDHSSSPEFTIVVLPDTQRYARDGSWIFAAQTQWIVDELKELNILFVSQLGDCVENGDIIEAEWHAADDAFSLLEDPTSTGLAYGIPYGIAVGNHDQTPRGEADGDTTMFYNEYFGVSRFIGRPYYGGHYDSNNDNHYQLVSAGDLHFLVVNLEYDETPDESVLAWADCVLDRYSDRYTIIVSHYLLDEADSFSPQGQIIYNRVRNYDTDISQIPR